MTTALVIFLAAIGGSLIQAVTGFGAGIFMMLFFPSLLPLVSAVAVSSAIGLSITGTMAYTYRKTVRKDMILVPAVCYLIASTLAINFAVGVNTGILIKVFGVFLIILSIYFLFFSNSIHLKANLITAAICSTISGIASGLFGIGGPPMVIYFLAAIEDKETYLGTIQAFFFLTSLWTFAYRIIVGVYTWQLVPLTLAGICGVVIGKFVGKKIVDRIDANTMRKLVYIFLGFSGVMNLIG